VTDGIPGFAACPDIRVIASALARSARFAPFPLPRSLPANPATALQERRAGSCSDTGTKGPVTDRDQTLRRRLCQTTGAAHGSCRSATAGRAPLAGAFVPSSNACRDPTPLAQAIPCSIAHARISRLRCGQKIGRSARSNVGEYVEPNTLAQTVENRPVFKEMLRRIVEERDVACVLIY
jgi:hypothetical protein